MNLPRRKPQESNPSLRRRLRSRVQSALAFYLAAVLVQALLFLAVLFNNSPGRSECTTTSGVVQQVGWSEGWPRRVDIELSSEQAVSHNWWRCLVGALLAIGMVQGYSRARPLWKHARLSLASPFS